MRLDQHTGLLDGAIFIQSPNCDDRPPDESISALVLHCISLPPGVYAEGDAQSHPVAQFFQNSLPSDAHPYFAQIDGLRVSAHLFIRRSGQVIQFVPLTKRAWHAGESYCAGRTAVNDFSIGIELEGWDEGSDGYTDAQYEALSIVLEELVDAYPGLGHNSIFAHSDIAAGRKSDPGPHFDWSRVLICK